TEIFLDQDGRITGKENAFIPSAKDIALTAEILGGYSLYAFDEEIKNGFITIEGGHRVGICGKVVADGGKIKTLRNISSLNFRLARQIKGCGDEALKYITYKGRFFNTLIISPPGGGKTTVLRDVIRRVSDGFGDFKGMTVGVCDERSEIAASFRGRAVNDIGIRTDVVDSCPKSKGMMILLRSMSPEVIAADEIGSEEDMVAIRTAVLSGVKLICTSHGEDIKDAERYKGIFERYVLLYGPQRVGGIKAVYNGSFEEMTGSAD
ncbi:MAG: stage III sporulation protein AA, partial [Lachnospiraceae bacterium]|nr:stage III sporulation protein AA [Lachnospiraceae bacterium]